MRYRISPDIIGGAYDKTVTKPAGRPASTSSDPLCGAFVPHEVLFRHCLNFPPLKSPHADLKVVEERAPTG